MIDEQTRIDRYEVQEVIGRGAMGVVYRALDPVIGRVVALKTIHRPDDGLGPVRSESLERFSREARAAGLLSHPNIVTVYDVGSADGNTLSYIAMEFVEGRTLRQMAHAGKPMPSEMVLEIALQVARALDYAHRRGVIHRDVKPANILIREDGLVKLADFGVARIDVSDLTRTGQSVGSPAYIAPEILLEQPTDGRADLFSLGVILYELLTGGKPFQGETLAALYHRVIAVTPEPPSRVHPAVPLEWDKIVLKLLAKSPGDRYASAAQLIEDLRAIETGRPLRHAAGDPTGVDPLLVVTGDKQIPEIELDRVIAEATSDPGTRAPTAPRRTPLQVKALLAMVAVAGFALTIILMTALLRQAPADPAAALAEQGVAAPVDLTVRLAHNLKAGRLRITMDDRVLLAESFSGERSRMRMQGTLTRRLEVPVGKHLFRVTVQEESGRSWTAETTRDLPDGGDATLFVEVKGILRKDLDLTWY
ncbi:MAG TPA: serine/threonine-protein kinase [Candidatus Polarisedimenticolia bacterium]|jgi:predicted Ser/Thr protein kinase